MNVYTGDRIWVSERRLHQVQGIFRRQLQKSVKSIFWILEWILEWMNIFFWTDMGRCIDLDGFARICATFWTMMPSTDDLSSKGGVEIYIWLR